MRAVTLYVCVRKEEEKAENLMEIGGYGYEVRSMQACYTSDGEVAFCMQTPAVQPNIVQTRSTLF